MSRKIDKYLLLDYFVRNPEKEYHVREIARLMKASPSTVRKYLGHLVRDGFLNKRRERRHLLFKAKTESDSYRDWKRYVNIRRIRESGLVEHLVIELHEPLAIVLFGSYAKAENTETSDVDLFVVANAKKEVQLEECEKKLSAEIQLFVHTPEEVKVLKEKSSELLNNVINGTVLYGYLEVLP